MLRENKAFACGPVTFLSFMKLSYSSLATAAVCVTAFTLSSCNDSKSALTAEVRAATQAAARVVATPEVVATSGPSAPDPASIPVSRIADAATITARPQVPILCYHQIRDWRPRDSKGAKDYIVPVEQFKKQIQMLADSGYHTILPDQLYAYLTTGAALPSKPIMLTFDDGDLDQYETAVPILDKHGFKGAFFIMTVAIGRRGKQPYMDKAQIKDLSDRGHAIGSQYGQTDGCYEG